jgi:hypothetical protein
MVNVINLLDFVGLKKITLGVEIEKNYALSKSNAKGWKTGK